MVSNADQHILQAAARTGGVMNIIGSHIIEVQMMGHCNQIIQQNFVQRKYVCNQVFNFVVTDRYSDFMLKSTSILILC